MGMTKESSNSLAFCDIRQASTIMEDMGIATHWELDHSDDEVFGVAGQIRSEDPVNTHNIRLRGHWW